MRPWFALFCALAACGTPCPSDPLTPAAGAGWVVRFNALPNVAPPSTTPGEEALGEPPGLGTYAAFALYDDSGAIMNERWLDSATTLVGVVGGVNAATVLPQRLEPSSLTVLLADGLRSALTFDLSTGARGLDLTSYSSLPDSAGQLVDLVALGDGTALVSRRRAADGLGGDVLRVDREADLGVLASFSLGLLSDGRVEPGNIAALGDRAVVGLGLLDEPATGAVAVLDLNDGSVTRLELFGLSGCGRVVSLELAGRVGVLCTGDLETSPESRTGAGFALLEGVSGEPVQVVATRPAARLFAGRSPTHGLVRLRGDWVAAVARGDALEGRPDALMAVHLSSDAASLLHEEAPDESYGAELGQGDFRDELWWPSARGAIYRWSMTGTDNSATFALLEPSAALPGCSRLPPREVRALPSPSTLPMP